MKQNSNKTIKLCDKDKCTACLACVEACPVHCINIGEDECGNMTPVMDSEKCISCGKCQRVCPMISKVTLSKPQKVYASYSKNGNRHIKSASGGIATELAKKVIERGGVVYGASQIEELKIEHVRIERADEISRIQGSKYVHSHIREQYNQIENDLKKDKRVLFVGTPCQVSALKNYLDDSLCKNLICVDLICHGVPSWKTFFESMKYETGVDDFKEWKVSFRDSDGFVIKLFNPNGDVEYIGNLKNSFYYNGFMEGYIYRRNCYSCEYAQSNRVGDITLGDFWGLGKDRHFEGDKTNGINVVLINSKKGEGLFGTIKDNVECWERQLEEAVAGNGQLREPSKQTKTSSNFIKLSQKNNSQNVNNANAESVVKCNKKKYTIIRIRRAIYKRKNLEKVLKKIPIIKNKI